MRHGIAVLASLMLCSLIPAKADFSDTLNLRSTPGKGAWIAMRTVTWRFDTADFVKGRSRLDIEVIVGNSG